MSRRIGLAIKRAFDIVVSFTVLTLLSPLMALIALAIKLEAKAERPSTCTSSEAWSWALTKSVWGGLWQKAILALPALGSSCASSRWMNCRSSSMCSKAI